MHVHTLTFTRASLYVQGTFAYSQAQHHQQISTVKNHHVLLLLLLLLLQAARPPQTTQFLLVRTGRLLQVDPHTYTHPCPQQPQSKQPQPIPHLPAWYMGPAGATISMISLLPP